jgi:hypothetical protein
MSFQEGVYYYKTDLIKFCKEKGLPYSGYSKIQLEEMLRTGIMIKRETFKSEAFDLVLKAVIPKSFKISYEARDFFESHIPNFKYNIRFNAWMKVNKGIKTFQDAIAVYHVLKTQKNAEISSQFKYMTYIRDFFKDNPNRTKEEAIKCWLYKKTQPFNHKYEPSDLTILED